MDTRKTKKNIRPDFNNRPCLNLVNDIDQIEAILDAPDSQVLENDKGESSSMDVLMVDQEDLDNLGADAEEIDENFGAEADELKNLREENFSNDEDELFSQLVDSVEVRSGRDEIPAKIPKVDPKGRGRAISSVWNDFHSTKNLPETKVQCNFCGVAVSKKVERLRRHLENNCKMKAKVSVSGRKSVPEPRTAKAEEVTYVQTVTSSKRNIQGKMVNFVDKVSKPQQEKLNLEIGKYLFSTNLPFSHVENPAFSRFIKTFRPACKIPSRRTIGNSILNKVYSEVKEKQDEALAGKNVTIMQDGWKTRTSEPVISHSITTGEKSYFWNAVNAEENKKTAEYCCMLLVEAIRELTKLGANVVAVVTDNCASMVRMRELVGIDFPNIFTYGCHVHLLNLIGKRFTPDDVISRVRDIHTFFRGHDAAWALLKKQKCGRPVLPHDIRWNAWIECLEYFLKHQPKMLEVSRNPKAKCTGSIEDMLIDGQFYADVKAAASIMKPVQVYLDMLQKENATLADGVDAWVSLESTLDFRDITLRNYFQEQFDKALQPVGIAAHMLHPTYRGRGLRPDLLAIGNEFLVQHRPYYVVIASKLRDKNEQLFPSHMFTDEILKKCSPSDWWNTLECLESLDRDIIKFASKLLKLPAGSADIERHFSILGNIMGVRRSRLGLDKAAKLCVIYKHLAGRDAPGDDGGDWDIPEDD